jgi:3-methyladenine DNA glycosylase AlkC
MTRNSQSRRNLHPSQRFTAPATIQKGLPLAELVARQSIRLLAESFESVAPSFDSSRFIRQAMRGLDQLGLMQRAAHVGRALAEQLPSDFDAAAPLIIASLGPELSATEGNGLAPFFYLPHSHVIGEFGPARLQSGLLACYQLTKRFTAEFCIRPFLVAHQTQTLRALLSGTADPNPHVRRLVSEGTRPRLPWAMRLKPFQQNARLTLPLLEKLKDDSHLYVRRSVANHLADIAKDQPDVAHAVCEEWLKEASSTSLLPDRASARRWIVRHALRLPSRRGHPHARRLRNAAANSQK